jgi:hypothetical protein
MYYRSTFGWGGDAAAAAVEGETMMAAGLLWSAICFAAVGMKK